MLASTPEIMELIERYQWSSETPQQTVLRLMRQGVQLQQMVDQLARKVEEEWPEKQRA